MYICIHTYKRKIYYRYFIYLTGEYEIFSIAKNDTRITFVGYEHASKIIFITNSMETNSKAFSD